MFLMKYAVIFDMDGVVIDSNPLHEISWKNFLVKKGLPFNDDIFDDIISGKTGSTSLRLLLGPGLADDVITAYVNEIDEEFQKILGDEENVSPMPGLVYFLQVIKAAGYKTALATSAPTANVELTLDKTNLREFFDVILDKTDVSKGKPNPEVYLKTVSQLGIKKEHCVVFEDSRAGIESAINANLTVIGVTTGHSREELQEEGVSMVIDDYTNLDLEDVINLISGTNH